MRGAVRFGESREHGDACGVAPAHDIVRKGSNVNQERTLEPRGGGEPPAEGAAESAGASRRQFIAAAAGALGPVVALMQEESAEAGRARRRHRRHRRRRRDRGRNSRPTGMFADDVILNLINQTSANWEVCCRTTRTRNHWTTLAAGRESGWNPGMKDYDFGGTLQAEVRWNKESSRDRYRNNYYLYLKNPEVGTPDVELRANLDDGSQLVTIYKGELSEGQMVERVYDGLKFIIHRWDDGDETFDDETEEYCRFVFRIHPV